MLEKRFTLGLAESCTGGLLADTVTGIPGCSAYFKGGVVAYHPEVKVNLLQIDPGLLKDPGVVSEAVAAAMARAARRIFLADLGLGITGVAGPGGGSPETPVGLVYIAVDSKAREICRQFLFSGSRVEIKQRSVQAALSMLGRILGAG
ncbi:MAG TPA: CinA family protein [Firmicutes bacterium]|nr:CinA family protein [Bacillota bacterium]